jgi:transposase
VQARWRTASRDDLIAELERQERQIERLRREHERADRDRNRYRNQRDQLQREIERLRDELDRARREARRQAAPFSRGAPRTPPRRPGRRAGPAYGRRAHRPVPRHIDERSDAPLPPACPDCGGRLALTGTATQYQEDLPRYRPLVRVFDVAIGHCQACHRRVQGRHRLQTSDALGAAAAQLGPEAVTLAAVLNKQLGVPLAKISTLFSERFGLTVTPGGLVHALHRAARRARPTYAGLREQIRGSPVVSPDETGWRVGAQSHWLWAFATPDTTVYAIQAGRGFEEAATVLGPDFDGVLVRDGWSPYRRFERAGFQTCVAHILRRCRHLVRDHHEHRFAPALATLVQQGLAVRERWRAGTMSAQGVAVARGQLVHRLVRLLDQPGPTAVAQRFARHLTYEGPGLFTFLIDPAIDATNWRAEHAIRPAVVTRKVCGGNRTLQGAQTQEVLASVLRTLHLRRQDASPIFQQMLCSPEPIILLSPPSEMR